jgi:hypothetical protein
VSLVSAHDVPSLPLERLALRERSSTELRHMFGSLRPVVASSWRLHLYA